MEQLEQFTSVSNTNHKCVLFLSGNIGVLLHNFWPMKKGSIATSEKVHLKYRVP